MRSSFSMFLLYHAYIYLELLILTCTIYILAPQNLSKYIKQYRMEKAKELLTDTNMKIVNISEKTGYPNVSYFCQSFREYFGVSPQKFRDKGEVL